MCVTPLLHYTHAHEVVVPVYNSTVALYTYRGDVVTVEAGSNFFEVMCGNDNDRIVTNLYNDGKNSHVMCVGWHRVMSM